MKKGALEGDKKKYESPIARTHAPTWVGACYVRVRRRLIAGLVSCRLHVVEETLCTSETRVWRTKKSATGCACK